MELPSTNQNNCPLTAVCEVTQPLTPACTSEMDLSPLPTAEQLCTRALADRIEVQQRAMATETSPAKIAESHVAATWLAAELAIAQADPIDAPVRWEQVARQAENAVDNPYARFKDGYNAAILSLYAPQLLQRKHNSTGKEKEDLLNIRRGLNRLYGALKYAPAHGKDEQHIATALMEGKSHGQCVNDEGERLGIMTKLVGMTIAARQGIRLHPGSPRERFAGDGWSALQHDAYTLNEDNQKTLIKFMSRSRSDANASGSRSAHYDNTVVFINLRATINEALNDLKRDELQHFKALCNGKSRPDINDFGQLLRTEISNKTKLTAAQLALLDSVSSRVEQQILAGESNPALLSLPAAVTAETPTAELPNGESYWTAVAHDLLNFDTTKPRSFEGPKRREDAEQAVESYLQYCNNPVESEALQQLIRDMRRSTHPRIVAQCVGAYIDLARNPQTQADQAVQLIEASQQLGSTITTKDWRSFELADMPAKYYAALHGAYARRYIKELSGEAWSVNDEAQLYIDLIELGKDMIAPGNVNTEVRGLQLELGFHILNARLNVRNGEVVQSVWPSLPRQSQPHDFNFAQKASWNMAVTRGSFLDQDEECLRVKLRSYDNGDIYDPAVVLIAAKEDLKTLTTADIINEAIRELQAPTPAIQERHSDRLNKYEAIFLAKLAL